MAASPHLRPDLGTAAASSSLAPVAYNSAGKAGRTHGAGVSDNWKPQEGQVVEGKFRLLQLLGGSDHSVVFLTERPEEPKKAVIKLRPAVNAENQVLRWKLDTKLPHPNLLRIFDSGKCELNGQPLLYVVMEYAEEDLSQILPHRPLTPLEAREMLFPVLDALAYLHGKGFAHGSIKPANILAIADQVKLSSDSISAISEGVAADGLSAVSAYDPPEVKEGKISPASDIWSLGITLAEILTLQKPVWDAVKKQEPTLPKNLDESFRILIRNCLRLEASSRWTTAEIKSVLQPEKATVAKVTRGSKSSLPFYVVSAIVLLIGSFIFIRGKYSEPSPTNTVEFRVGNQKSSSAESASQPPNPKNTSPNTDAPKPKRSIATAAVKSAPSQASSSVVQQVMPEVPASARNTITGKIRIRVKVAVDANGNVTEAALDSPSKSNYFNRLAQQAAEKWKFAPAASEWFIHFTFTSRGNDAVPEQVTR